MKIKTNYMSAEFKDRQGSFAFFCAQAFDFMVAFRNECRKGWYEMHQAKRKIQQCKQFEIWFDTVKTLTEWTTWTPTKNYELFD